MLSKAVVLTYRIPLILVEDLAVTPVHVGHVNGVAICPIDFPVLEGAKRIASNPIRTINQRVLNIIN